MTEKYKLSDIDRVLNPAIDELKIIGLEVHKKYEKRKNKGRPKLEGYWFSFKAEQKEKTQTVQPTQIDSSNIKEKQIQILSIIWKQCKKQLENNGTLNILYGHTVLRFGDCSYTTYDFADLIENINYLY